MEADKFWSQDLSILYQKDRLIEFFPTKDMTLDEKLNAIARLSIYSGIALFVYQGNTIPLYITLIGLAFTLFLHKTSKGNREKKQQEQISEAIEEEQEILPVGVDPTTNQKCILPTRNNPFMNVTANQYLDNPERPPACNYDVVKDRVEDNFNYNLYKDVDDVFDKNNSQFRFNTNPYTTIPNDQGAFARWLYSVPATCKENQENCLRYEDVRSIRGPIIDYEDNPIKYT